MLSFRNTINALILRIIEIWPNQQIFLKRCILNLTRIIVNYIAEGKLWIMVDGEDSNIEFCGIRKNYIHLNQHNLSDKTLCWTPRNPPSLIFSTFYNIRWNGSTYTVHCSHPTYTAAAAAVQYTLLLCNIKPCWMSPGWQYSILISSQKCCGKLIRLF